MHALFYFDVERENNNAEITVKCEHEKIKLRSKYQASTTAFKFP